ncbi:MAG: hypothetical protein Q8O59_04255 [bacterium]|nr:hypothetical protein [bacterium]
MANVIRRRDDFASEEKLRQTLLEGHGVVVIGMGTRGFRAYGDSWDAGSFEGEDYLRKNLAGANYNHGENAFLVIRENGKLVWQPGKQKPVVTHRRVSAIPLWKQKKRFHFSETNGNAVA